MMPAMVASQSTASTTTIDFMQQWLAQNLTLMQGSVITGDASLTTVQLDCNAQSTAQCDSSGMVWPITVTVGESIQGLNYDITSYFGSTLFIVTGAGVCTVTDGSMGASCSLSTSSWFSSGTTSNSSSVDNSAFTISPTISYVTVDVTSGLDKLAHSATTTSAAPASTATTTSATQTSSPTATATSTSSPSSSSSSSKAWIAGAVIGAVAGVALIGALAFWLLRRKRKNNSDAEGVGAGSAGATDAVAQQNTREMQGNWQPSELHGDLAPTELPPDTSTRAELPVTEAQAQLDFDKKQQMERSQASELP
ncbi:hypothetical protein N7478_013157 [Penicillium angulare]|uniref:uncharacterized protein n=1 Tax=Penicillium angulare TaxID=116970 RepID=UPI00253F9DD8|nr:uncharacterized protein N7478_013157 [Penicillium angulare]KAJ5257053.1 hypothetical protein N7478_013157 [Penicillium angulare]